MQRLWGRKVSDLAFGEFLQILEWVARKKQAQQAENQAELVRQVLAAQQNGGSQPVMQEGRAKPQSSLCLMIS